MSSFAERKTPKIFISYKHNVDPDDGLARQIYEALSATYSVFRDREKIQVGQKWAQRIQKELSEADFMITLLSAESLESEMVKGEIERAHQFNQEQGNPTILPIRVAHKKPFDQPISLYLNDIQWTYWENEKDTPRLIKELEGAIKGAPLACTEQPVHQVQRDADALPSPRPMAQIRVELPEGTMDPHSEYYVSREADAIALGAISMEGGITIPIKGPRQVGKSSLLMRIMNEAEDKGKHIVFLDFQQIGQESLRQGTIFYKQFCSWISDELDLDDRVDKLWSDSRTNGRNCTKYMADYVLKEVDFPVVLAMDEVERVFETTFQSDFFSMLRSWHNLRARKAVWRKLDMVLVTSTEPYQLIQNLNQSPFNVGEIIDLNDFTKEEVEGLNRQHSNTFSTNFINHLYDYLHGHPYLTRRAMYLVATGRYTERELIEQAADDDGPFGDHLRYHLFRLHDLDISNADSSEEKQELIDAHDKLKRGFRQVLRHKSCNDERIFWRLRGAGLVRKENQEIVARSRLYQTYFNEHLNE